MTQPGLFTDLPPARAKKRGHVPRTSLEAYRQAHPNGRAKEVLEWLTHYLAHKEAGPTSAELAQHAPFAAPECSSEGPVFKGWTDVLLYTRRGLSDLQVIGAVYKSGDVVCSVTHRKCATWRVRER